MILLVRVGELTVKRGWTRVEMERLLVKAIREAGGECGGVEIEKEPGRIYLRGDLDCLRQRVVRVFGVKSVSPTHVVNFRDLEELAEAAARLWSSAVSGRKFAVRVHRVGKHPFTSRDVAAAVGSRLIGGVVDLENPEVELYIEVRGGRAYLYTEVFEGPGGLPLGSEGKALALVSGGVDSPVAAWLTMRRGAHVDVLYCNLGGVATAKSALEVVRELLSWSYGYNARVVIADCGPVARAIRRHVSEELWGIAFKRALYLLGVEIAAVVKATALVTGESLGQVSSQTLQAMAAVERGIDMPILRPLVGMDKDEIVTLARRIGTYQLSTRVPEHCAIFGRRPRKWATVSEVEKIDLAIVDVVREVARSVVVVRKSQLSNYIDSLSPPLDIEIEQLPPDAVVVDLRDAEAYGKWHFPNAVRVEVDRVVEFVEKCGFDKTYVFYCHGGVLSREVAEGLRKLGVRAFSMRRPVA